MKSPRRSPKSREFDHKKLYLKPDSRVFSWLSQLCGHEGEVVGEELSGHAIDKASKVACLGRLGGEHLREFADGGFHHIIARAIDWGECDEPLCAEGRF